MIQDFNYYKNLFLEVSDEKDLTSIKNEFSEYLSDAAPDNLDIETLNFWFSSQHNYPNLSKIAINFLCIPCGSCDAESSFSKLRDVNTIKRSNSDNENEFRHIENAKDYVFQWKH